MGKKRIKQPKRREPRPEEILSATPGLIAKAWSYANPGSHDVVVQVRGKKGVYLGTVTVRVKQEPEGSQNDG